jgi:membrane protein implicated in regulation of membrane protease activity
MTWPDLYLICFIVGFTLSLISVVGGFFHVPGLHHAHGHHGHAHLGHAHVRAGGPQVSPFNLSTITAFLAWFGGIGYLLTKFSGIWLWLAFLFSVAGGLFGGSIIFLFLVKVLLAHDQPLDAADYAMIGVLGHLTSAIRESGTGEMSFSQGGVRRSSAARSEDGTAIPKGADVVVTQYEKGIAYVRRWEDLTDSTAWGDRPAINESYRNRMPDGGPDAKQMSGGPAGNQ